MGKRIFSVLLAALIAMIPAANICCAEEVAAAAEFKAMNIADKSTHTFTVRNNEDGETATKPTTVLYDGATNTAIYSDRNKETFASYEIELPEVKSVDKVRLYINFGNDWFSGAEKITSVTLKDETGSEVKTVSATVTEAGWAWAEYDFEGAYGKTLVYSQNNPRNYLYIGEAEVYDAQLVSVPFEKNADAIVTLDKTDDNGKAYAEIDANVPFMDNLPANYFGTFGGRYSAYFGSEGYVKVAKKYRETADTTAVTTSATEYVNIPIDTDGYATGAYDAFLLRTPAAGEEGGEPSFTVNLKQMNTKSVYFLAQHATEAKFNYAVTYADGSSENLSTNGHSVEQLTYSKPQYYSVKDSADRAGIYGVYSKGNLIIYPSTNANATVQIENTVSYNNANKTIGEVLYKIDLDASKIPVSVTITNSNNISYPTVIFSVLQEGASVSSMMETVKEAEAIDAGIFTEAQIELIKKANAYADALEGKYFYDFTAVRELKAVAARQADLAGIKNIAFEKNADTFVVLENGTATINPDTWFAGLLDNYSAGFFEQGFSGGEMNAYNSKISNGYMTFNEMVYDETSAAATTSFEGAREYKIPVNTLVDGENDSYIVSTSVPYGKETANAELCAELKHIPTTSVYLITNTRADLANKVEVTYEDGTVGSYSIQNARSAGFGSKVSTILEHVTIGTDGTVERNVTGMNGRIAGKIDMGYASYKTEKITADGTRGTTLVSMGNQTRALNLVEIMTDAGKIPVSVKVYANGIYPLAIYSIAQETVDTATMLAELEAARNLSYTDEDFAAEVAKAAVYRKTLAYYGIIDEADYAFVDTLNILLGAEKNEYVDLTNYVDTDLMTVSGASLPESGRTVPEAQKNTDHNYNVYYNASAIPGNGVITMKAPGHEKFEVANGGEAGQDYKLSGAYNGVGNDAVKVAPNAEVTIPMSNAHKYAKTLSLMLDTVYAGETLDPNSASVTSQTDMHGYIKVPVKLNYTDGTSEIKSVRAYLATGYYHPSVYSYAGMFGRLYFDGEKITGSSKNTAKMFASNVEFNASKTLSGITFMNDTNNEYHVLAITRYAYTNAELEAADTDAIDAADENTTITFANAKTLALQAKAVLEKARRGIGDEISAERQAEVEAIMADAFEFEAVTANKVFAKTILDKEAKTLTATFANTTAGGKYYSVIVAIYDGNKLVEVSYSPYKLLDSGAYDVTETVSFDTEASDEYEYKVFIWNAIDALIPLATSAYPY